MPLTRNSKSEIRKWLPSGPPWTSSNTIFRNFSFIKRSFENFFSAKTPETFSDRKIWLSMLCVCQKVTREQLLWAWLSIYAGSNIILFWYFVLRKFSQHREWSVQSQRCSYHSNISSCQALWRWPRFYQQLCQSLWSKNSLKASKSVDWCFWTCVTSKDDFPAKSNIQIWVDWFRNCELLLFSETLPAMAKFCCNYWERSATFSHDKRARVASLVLKRMLVRPAWSASNYSLQWNKNYNQKLVISDFIPSELFKFRPFVSWYYAHVTQ